MITIKWHRCRARLLLLLMVFTALYSLLLLSVFMDSGLGLSASSSPTPPCMWLHTGMGIKDEQRNWDFLFSFFFFFPTLSLFHVCCSPTFSLAGREVSYAFVVWDWRMRNHTQYLGSLRGPLEALNWNWGNGEHVSKSAKMSESCGKWRESRQETMLLGISYVSNQGSVPCS